MDEIQVTLPDGRRESVAAGTAANEILAGAKVAGSDRAVAVKIDDRLRDVYTPVVADARLAPVVPESEDGIEVLRHSSAHLMAQAVNRLFPNVEFAIGPTIEDGFYYDFDTTHTFSPEDFEKIEAEMTKIVAEDLPIRRIEMTKEEALAYLGEQNAKFKIELLREVKEATVSFYRQGEFTDWCRGPHLPSTGRAGAFKLLSIAGAYWRGDEHRDMLQRIYATAWPSRAELDAYVHRLEEAKKRDHKKLGRELDLFLFHKWAPASPFFLPKGATVYNLLVEYIRELTRRHGYSEVITPQIFDIELYKTSGHYDNFRDGMFFTSAEEREFSVKPMNCPGHCLMFGARHWSYRDLPVRYADFGRLHRRELSGVTQGLTRVRTFAQDDAHVFCAPEQVDTEMAAFLDLIDELYRTFGFGEVTVALSTRPEGAPGEAEKWAFAEAALARSLDAKGIPYKLNPGEGAFYGPKLEWQVKDAIGRSWQLGTLQFDIIMPERFGLEFIASSGSAERPVMLHRAMLGSLERFLGILIEHTAGAFPTWLAPVQALVLPVSDKFLDAAESAVAALSAAGIRADADRRNEKLGAKIREAQLHKVPYMLVIGKREAETGAVAVRRRDGRDLGAMPLAAFIAGVREETANRSRELTLEPLPPVEPVSAVAPAAAEAAGAS